MTDGVAAPVRRGRLAMIADVFRTAGANAGLRRAVVAYAGFVAVEYAGWIAMIVYAYDVGGAGVAAAVNVAGVLPAVVLAPFLAARAERADRRRVLILAFAVPAVATLLTGLVLVAASPAIVVFAMAVIGSTSLSLTRPVHGAALVELATTPAELTAANAATSLAENIVALVAPILGGIGLAIGGAGLVYLACGLGLVASTILVMGIRMTAVTPAPDAGSPATDSDADKASEPAAPGTIALVRAGIGVVVRDPVVRGLVLLLGMPSFVAGALDVLFVVLAYEILLTGDAGVGLLNAAYGAGGLIGAAVTLSLVGWSRLSLPAVAALVFTSLPVALIAGLPWPIAALPLVGIVAAARGVSDVAGLTLLQRVAPPDTLTRILGLLEGGYYLTFGLGSASVAILLAAFGSGPTLVVIGLSMALLAVVIWPSLRRADLINAPIGDAARSRIDAIRSSRIFGPLPAATLEHLAATATEVRHPAGTWVIREGESGDRYYVLSAGAVEVSIEGVVVGRLGPGEGFGEIALLRDVPRTASIRAVAPVVLLAFERADFLGAVAGVGLARRTAEGIAVRRLSADRVRRLGRGR